LKRVVAFTVAFGSALPLVQRCAKAFRALHPEIPFTVFSNAEYAQLFGRSAPGHPHELVCLRTMVGYLLSQEYERVIYLDADTFPVARLEDLIEFPGAAALTHDASYFDMGAPEWPVLNSGVCAAASPDFWYKWMWSCYAFLVPAGSMVGMDQYLLRLLADRQREEFIPVPEADNGRLLNVSYLTTEGEWRWDGSRLWKGDYQVLLYHQAGPGEKSDDLLPAPVLEALQAVVASGSEVVAEPGLEEGYFLHRREGLEAVVKKLFMTLPTLVLNVPIFISAGAADNDRAYISAAPMEWDNWRISHKDRFWRMPQGAVPIYAVKPNVVIG